MHFRGLPVRLLRGLETSLTGDEKNRLPEPVSRPRFPLPDFLRNQGGYALLQVF